MTRAGARTVRLVTTARPLGLTLTLVTVRCGAAEAGAIAIGLASIAAATAPRINFFMTTSISNDVVSGVEEQSGDEVSREFRGAWAIWSRGVAKSSRY